MERSGRRHPCPVCSSRTLPVGTVDGRLCTRTFTVRRCPACRFAFVEDPCRDYARLYGEEYYSGRGADPLVDYAGEAADPDRTVRNHEWRGIHRIVSGLVPLSEETRWLDFGCGLGGLVGYLQRTVGCDALGHEEGWAAEACRQRGVPLVTPDDGRTFDVVTAIEVIEHIEDPVAALAEMGRRLRPGGLLFLTTGNARPFREAIARWRYIVPEIHISLFEPQTLALALGRAGLLPGWRKLSPGDVDIIRFKVLKNLGRTRRSPVEGLVPWSALARVVDWRLAPTAHPVGWAPRAASKGPGR